MEANQICIPKDARPSLWISMRDEHLSLPQRIRSFYVFATEFRCVSPDAPPPTLPVKTRRSPLVARRSGNAVRLDLWPSKRVRHPSRNANHETGGQPQPVAVSERRAARGELLNDFAAAKHRGEHQRRHPTAIVGVNVRAVFQEQGDDLLVTLERHATERRLAAIIPAIRFRAEFEQHLRG